MIDALISGKLYGQPQQRTGNSGKTFTTAKVRAATGGGETLFVNVIAFSTTVQDALLTLGDGDSIALSGELTPKVWTDRNGEARPALDMVAHAAMTAYHVSRKRKEVGKSKQKGADPAHARGGDLPGDDIDSYE
jgi:single-stranded DNA-binding protein